MGQSELALAARLLERLRAGDRLDELARDHGTTVEAIRHFFASLGIERRELAKLRSRQRSPGVNLPEELDKYTSRRRTGKHISTATRPLWSNADMLERLENAATMAFPLTAVAYDKLREGLLVTGPSSQLIALRFGTWARACEIAGVECGNAPRESYTSPWTNGDLLGFVQDYLSTTYAPSFNGYQEWAHDTEGAPSGQTLRNRLGSWSQIRAIALQAREGNGGRS